MFGRSTDKPQGFCKCWLQFPFYTIRFCFKNCKWKTPCVAHIQLFNTSEIPKMVKWSWEANALVGRPWNEAFSTLDKIKHFFYLLWIHRWLPITCGIKAKGLIIAFRAPWELPLLIFLISSQAPLDLDHHVLDTLTSAPPKNPSLFPRWGHFTCCSFCLDYWRPWSWSLQDWLSLVFQNWVQIALHQRVFPWPS